MFLDRDGVLTVEKGYVCRTEDLEIFPYAAECVRQIHEKGYLAIVVTNQSGVANGLFTEEKLREMNGYLMQETGVDTVYYCPHHPEGKVPGYAVKCRCRKPGTGMFEEACQDYVIDIKNSFMVGDRASDILMGRNAGLKTVLLESGYGTARLEEDVRADYEFENLSEFVKVLLYRKTI